MDLTKGLSKRRYFTYDHSLKTFIEVTDCGSFLKASEKLFISPTAVMKQMTRLEQHIGLPLMIRTNKGIRLTEAGKSLCEDAKKGCSVVRIGTSALYPCKILMKLWNSVSGNYPDFKLKLVPFEDTETITAFSEIGKKYDLMIGPHNSVTSRDLPIFSSSGNTAFSLPCRNRTDFRKWRAFHITIFVGNSC